MICDSGRLGPREHGLYSDEAMRGLTAGVLHDVRDLILHSTTIRSVSVEANCGACVDDVWMSHLKQAIQGYFEERTVGQAAQIEQAADTLDAT